MQTGGVLVFPNQDLEPEENLQVNKIFDYHRETDEYKFSFG